MAAHQPAVRIIQDSATVACLTAVGLVMPVIEQLNYSGAQMAALSISFAGVRFEMGNDGWHSFVALNGPCKICTP